MNPWRKLILFSAIVLLPAIVVGIGNFKAFPDSFLLATFMLLATVIVSGVFTWKSKDATQKVQRYCLIADILICVILCVNVGGHWIFSREVSGAKQATIERNAEEDRQLERERVRTELEIARKKAEAEAAAANTRLANAEARRLAQLPASERRARSAPRREVAPPPVPEPVKTLAAQTTPAPRLTLEQVYEKWWWFLTALAFAECFASVLAGAVLMAVWEWDRDRDGVPDNLQRGRGTPLFAAAPVEGFARASKDHDPKARSDRE
jgi:hypothetical protein